MEKKYVPSHKNVLYSGSMLTHAYFLLPESNPALRTPHHCGQFSLSWKKTCPYISLNSTRFIRTCRSYGLFLWPPRSVSVLTGFDCNSTNPSYAASALLGLTYSFIPYPTLCSTFMHRNF